MKACVKARYYFTLALGFLLALSSCEEAEEKESTEDQLHEVMAVGTDFMNSMCYRNFEDASELSDKLSQASIKKLSAFQDDFLSISFTNLDTCKVEGNAAECICNYSYDGYLHNKIVLHLIKYEDEWKVNFLLDENFNNIFMYNYSSEPFKGQGKWNHMSLAPDVDLALDELLNLMNSNKMVMQMTENYELEQLDSLIIEQDEYLAMSKIMLDGFQLKKEYVLESGYVFEFKANLQTFTDNDMQFFFKAVVDKCVKRFGEPFNIRKEDNFYGYHCFHDLRWFIKGHNEVLTLNFSPGVFTFVLKPII